MRILANPGDEGGVSLDHHIDHDVARLALADVVDA